MMAGMGITAPAKRHAPLLCPACGHESSTVIETREPLRLSETPGEGRVEGERWVRYQPCGHEAVPSSRDHRWARVWGGVGPDSLADGHVQLVVEVRSHGQTVGHVVRLTQAEANDQASFGRAMNGIVRELDKVIHS